MIADTVVAAQEYMHDAHQSAIRVTERFWHSRQISTRYKSWFGTPNHGRLTFVRNVLEEMASLDTFSEMTFICHAQPRPRMGGWTAIAYLGKHILSSKDEIDIRSLINLPIRGG